MVYIRTDANDILATGHVMRCMTIANRLIKEGCKVTFLVSDIDSTVLLKEAGYEYINLESDWNNPDNEAEILKVRGICSIYKDKYKIKPMLLMDSYRINSSYTRKLKQYAVTAIIDDLYEEKYFVDMVINYTIYSVKFDYPNKYANTDTVLKLGGKFVPLRDEFLEAVENDYKQQNTKKKVLIICGGGDVYNAIGGILEAVLRINESNKYEYYAVVGAYNPNKERLVQYARQNSNIHICENVNNMSELMGECDIAVSAASTVLYECCAMQLPTIFFCVADNQKYDSDCFSENHMMIYAGDMQHEREKTIDNILKHLLYIIGRDDELLTMKEKMRNVVDCNGAQRIAEEIIKIHKAKG